MRISSTLSTSAKDSICTSLRPRFSWSWRRAGASTPMTCSRGCVVRGTKRGSFADSRRAKPVVTGGRQALADAQAVAVGHRVGVGLLLLVLAVGVLLLLILTVRVLLL